MGLRKHPKAEWPVVRDKLPWGLDELELYLLSQHLSNCLLSGPLWGISLVVEWLRPHVFTAEGVGSIPGQGT